MMRPGPPQQMVTPGMIRETLERHGSFTFRAYGGSMMPVVRHGEMIRIEPLAAAEARPGDILFFATPDGRFIGHRFIGWRRSAAGGRAMLTSGDTLPHFDQPHDPEHLLGLITVTTRGAERIALPRGGLSRLMALGSQLSCLLAAPFLSLSTMLAHGGLNRWSRPLIRYLFCGPVFILGALIRR